MTKLSLIVPYRPYWIEQKPRGFFAKYLRYALVRGQKRSEETKRKLLLTWTGRKHKESSKEKMRLAHLGKKLTEETKKKMSLIRKGKVSYYPSIETRIKQSLAKKGKHLSLKTEYKKGLFSKEKHPNWKGGISLHKRWTSSPENKIWRKEVFARDDYTCVMCGERGGKLHSHHIKSWAEYPMLRYEVSNGETVCINCHRLIHKTLTIVKRNINGQFIKAEIRCDFQL